MNESSIIITNWVVDVFSFQVLKFMTLFRPTPELTFHCVHQADLLHRIVLSLHTHTHTHYTHIFCNNERMYECVVQLSCKIN